MENNIQSLYDFLERAVRSRKYPENTAQGLRSAIKLFEAVLNEDEKNSLDKFKANFDQIYHSVSLKNGKNFSAGSLATYKSRVQKTISDYERYGIDPTKMASWSPKPISRSPRKQKSEITGEEALAIDDVPSSSIGMHKIELALRPDKKCIIVVPMDITPSEGYRIKALLDSLVVTPQD